MSRSHVRGPQRLAPSGPQPAADRPRKSDFHDQQRHPIASAIARRRRRRRSHAAIRGLSDRAIAWIFVAPTIALLLAINIFPLIWTIRLSLTNYRANRTDRDVEWVGLRNYSRILTDRTSGTPMQATAHFLFWTLFFQVLIGFALAWLINSKFRGNDLWTT